VLTRIVLALALASAASPARADRPIEFNRDIRPILADACFRCHGLDARARKAGLRLDAPEGAFAIRKGTTAIKPGDLKASAVWLRITSEDPDEVMPPPHSKKSLSAAQKETIRQWIEQGAKYQKHWSFEPIRRPAVPNSGAGTPIDAFLLDRLRRTGLSARPEADRETLIRRVAFALTGLPPTAAEVETFLADTDPNAYERMVDRYLASPRYGEEMARHWLDVVRYGDTHGLHLDNERNLWLYRDWVVRSFNRNLPFDQFTIHQLAGDLLPNPTPDQLTATGFNRCNVTTGEGGSIDAEWVYRNAVDRTTTAAQTWLGLTAGCAVCHDHKYDPLSAKEYYSLYAFFLSGADPALDGNISTTGPYLKVATPAQQAALDSTIKAEADARRRLEAAAADKAADYTDPADREAGGPRLVADVLFDDAFPLGSSARNTTRNAADWLSDPPFGAKSGRRVLRQANSFFHEDAIQPRLRPFVAPAKGSFDAWVRLDPAHPAQALAVQLSGGKKVLWGRETNTDSLYQDGKPDAGSRVGPLPAPGQWARLSVSTTELGLKEGHTVATVTLQAFGGVAYWDEVSLTGERNPAVDPLASFRVWWKGLGGKAPLELPADLHALVSAGPDRPHAAAAVARLKAFYLAYIARPVSDELAARLALWERTRADREAADAAIPGTMIFREAAAPRQAFVMTRGQYDRPGEKVQPSVPAVLPPLKPAGDRPTRLDLARWLVSGENPLTARVAVNRLWQQFFGIGLVRTGADFGTQGELPSHPELLDWLAAEYRDSGWDTRKLVKLLVMSDAFRRDAHQTPEARSKDPQNRLLGRGPRFRLDAEQLRDNALFVSGLLNPDMGGRGVRTYQPANIWEPVGYGDSNTRFYLQDHGAGLYRRSLYVFIKRTAPHPFLTNFDAPNREQLCSARERTNTPLQALQLMNDVQHVEAARALAERTIAEGGATSESRIAFLYRAVLSRRPDPEEIKLVSDSLARQLALYRADPASARKLVAVGESRPHRSTPVPELAAWTMVANLILNLDETLNRN
jgi:hypothetical protein